MLTDLVLSLRRLRTERTVTAAAILIAALAIGSSAAVLAALHRVIVAPLDYPAPQRLVRIVGLSSGVAGETNISPPDFRDLRRRLTTVRGLAAVSPFSPQVAHADGTEPQLVSARLISSHYFETLGVPVNGREFTEAEEQAAARVVVLGERWWRSRLAGRPDAVGSSIVLNGVGHTVVGIAGDREQVFGQPDVWLPMQLPSEQIRALRVAAVVGRLADGRQFDALATELEVLGSSLQREFQATNAEWRPIAVPLSESISGPARPSARLLGALVSLLWVATITALAGVAVARASARRGERALRLALGASRWRLLRAVLVEQGVMGLAMFGAGVIVALWLQGMLNRLGVLRDIDVTSLTVVQVSAAVLVALATLVSVAASSSVRVRPDLLVGRSVVSRTATRTGHIVVGTQLALAIVILALAASMAAGARALHSEHPGFEPRGAHYLRIVLPPRYAAVSQRRAFWSQLIAAVRTAPGITEAAITTELPFTGQFNPASFRARRPDGVEVGTDIRSVSPGYFEVTGLRLHAGTAFSEHDTPDARKTVVINEQLRRRLFQDASGLGETVSFNFSSPPHTAVVVGVVSDVRHSGPAGPPVGEAYFPVNQAPLGVYTLVVRSSLPADSVRTQLAAVMRHIDPDVPVPAPSSWSGAVAQLYVRYTWRAGVSLALAAVVLLLATVGVYASAAHVTSVRRREFAVRLALGATPAGIRCLILRDGARVAIAATILGVPLAWVLVRVAASWVEGASGNALLAGAGAAGLTLIAVVIASWSPAREASMLETGVLLRD